MDVDLLDSMIKPEEGLSLTVYHGKKDAQGVLTVGFGHKVLPGDNLALGDEITMQRALSLYDADRNEAIRCCEMLFGDDFDSYPPIAQAVLADCLFNMGMGRFSGFHDTIAAAKAHDWQGVADGLTDSLWHRQLPERSNKLIAMIRGATEYEAMA
jgi:GH24 family phage-related lysozyme (muramidase)